MYKRILTAILAAAISVTLFSACSSGTADESEMPDGTSSAPHSSEMSSLPPSSSEESSMAESSSMASSSTPSSSVSSGSSKPASSGSSSAASSNPGTKPSSKKDLYKEKEESFTFQDGTYRRVYGNRAIFVVTTDPAGKKDSELSKKAEEIAGDFYKKEYYCTVAFVKPDKSDGTFDMTKTKTDGRVAAVFDMHRPDIEKITINLKDKPLQEYIDKQIKKATLKS